MTKYKAITQETFNTLPSDIKEKIKNTLKAYNEINVEYENGQYIASVCTGITKGYTSDHKFIGVAYVDDFYSFEERQANFLQEFGYTNRVSQEKEEEQRRQEIGKVFIR